MSPSFNNNNIKRLSLAIALSISLTGCVNEEKSDNQTQALQATETSLDNTINLTQITKDVTYLASDELNGRGNFSKDIEKAAQYIAQRYQQVGLVAANNTDNFQQYYQIKSITPASLTVVINNNTLSADVLTMASTVSDFTWSENTANLSTHVISKDDNLRTILSNINQQGGQHLVLVDPSHEKTFKRYQAYFARGLNKLINENESTSGGIIVGAITDTTTINSLSISGTTNVNKTKISNVIGVLPGKSLPDEIVLYSAHYDHLGGISPDEHKSNHSDESSHQSMGQQIYNGADDDASGVSAIINLANHFKQVNNNERTLMFAAFSAEEIGGFGSKYFSAQLNPSDITAMINIEMIGKPAKFGAGTVWMTGMERSTLGEQLNIALKEQSKEIYADPYPEQNLFYRSDNATLARLGVPAHSFSSTQLDKDQHYHQVTDDINSLDLNSMQQVIKTLATATTPLVTGKITPSRIDTNLVKGKGLIF
ncbi:hypothetical protein GCM10009111_24610 [Colwellia asteriadis]|uniref:Peptidase M28 domain-containing protein n=1 Tax=Colwellia asteriadis TaxID=517723 RepID=A0ABN1L8N9_9GAMM